jgi:hypothetical protein
MSGPAAEPRGGYRPARRSGRRPGRLVAMAAVCIVALVLVAVAIAVAHHHAALRSQPPPPRAPVIVTPASTVRMYFGAINKHDYLRAWRLGGDNSGSNYSGFVHGFGTTARDSVRILAVSGDVVTARITAVQTDGSVKIYEGRYGVTGGAITKFDVRQVS